MFKLILLLNPVYITLFWAVVLSCYPRKTNVPKIFLGAFMIVACLLYLSHLFYYLPLKHAYHYADSFYQFFSLLLYPMYYIYIRLLTVEQRFSLKKHSRFFILPVCLFLLYSIGVLMMTEKEHLYFLYEYPKVFSLDQDGFLYQKIIYFACRITFMLQAIMYLILSLYLTKCNKNNIKDYYANTDDDNLDKVYFLSITLLVTMVSGIILSILGKERFLQHEYWLIAPSLIFLIMYFFIGWLGNRQRAVQIAINESFESETVQEKNSYTPIQLEMIRKKIEFLFEKEKIYLNKDLTIWELSRIIGTNRSYVSFVINNEFKQNFSSFVNTYRAKYAQRLLIENPDINKYDLADLSGFGSTISMQRAIKSLSMITKENLKLQ